MKNYAVAFPEAGELAIVAFEVGDLERLQGEIGEDYIQTIFSGLDNRHIGVIKRALVAGLKGGDIEVAMNALPISDLAMRIADALYLRLHGRTLTAKVAAQMAGAVEKSDA